MRLNSEKIKKFKVICKIISNIYKYKKIFFKFNFNTLLAKEIITDTLNVSISTII